MTNPYWDVIQALPKTDRGIYGRRSQVQRFNFENLAKGAEAREHNVVEYSWAIPAPWALQSIFDFAKKICEIGAGTGYWAQMLTQQGCSVVAYDAAVPGVDTNDWRHTKAYFNVLKGDANSIKNHQDHALMLCWPPFSESMAYTALKAYTGDKLIYIGEGSGGCTANDDFHDEVETTFDELEVINIPQWEGLNDRLYLYTRKQ